MVVHAVCQSRCGMGLPASYFQVVVSLGARILACVVSPHCLSVAFLPALDSRSWSYLDHVLGGIPAVCANPACALGSLMVQGPQLSLAAWPPSGVGTLWSIHPVASPQCRVGPPQCFATFPSGAVPGACPAAGSLSLGSQRVSHDDHPAETPGPAMAAVQTSPGRSSVGLRLWRGPCGFLGLGAAAG